MKRIMCRMLACILIYLLQRPIVFASSGVEIDSIQALRTLFREMTPAADENDYLSEPVAEGDFQAGELSKETLARALGEVNFLRALAGLDAVTMSDELNSLCQHGAVLLAANGELSHAPDRPEGMDEAFYALGRDAAARSNLARFNWTGSDLLREAALSFARDEGERNEGVLGHRRWLLCPQMGRTGFGLACDASGRTYALMYAVDDSVQADYDLVAWPGEGYFPAEYLTKDTWWSISPNPDRYDLQNSRVTISLEEVNSGARFEFDFAAGEGGCTVAGGRYGDGPAYAFRPALSEYEAVAGGYEQNQVWRVTLRGLIDAAGNEVEREYAVTMASLTPIDPAMVEFDLDELTVCVGASCRVEARVVPAWADDTSLRWSVEDESIATVDEWGQVTGQRPGRTRLTARAVNGREESVPVRVTR